ncbi:MAG: hypothetical protein ACYC3L_09100 [Gemmatimonadaceae bacterium]
MQAPPPPAQVPVAVGARTAPTATEMYEAAKLAQREVRNQRDELMQERRNLVSELEHTSNPAASKALESRVAVLDARIADVEKQVATAEQMVVSRAGTPGVVIQPEAPRENGPPEEVYILGGLSLLMMLLLPVSIGYARRLWRRGAAAPASMPPELSERMQNIERGIEAVAIEVERLGEGQRFVTQLLDAQSRRQLGADVRRSGQDA